MYVTKTIICLSIFVSFGSASAVTIEELSARNNRLIELNQQIELAKQEKTLADWKQISSPDAGVVKAQKAPKSSLVEDMYVKSVHGNLSAPQVEMMIGGIASTKAIGDSLGEGWVLDSVSASYVTIVKKGNVKNKVQDQHKTLVIGRVASEFNGGFGQPMPVAVPIRNAPIAVPSPVSSGVSALPQQQINSAPAIPQK